MLLPLGRACHKTKQEQNLEPKNSFALRLSRALLGEAMSTVRTPAARGIPWKGDRAVTLLKGRQSKQSPWLPASLLFFFPSDFWLFHQHKYVHPQCRAIVFVGWEKRKTFSVCKCTYTHESKACCLSNVPFCCFHIPCSYNKPEYSTETGTWKLSYFQTDLFIFQS